MTKRIDKVLVANRGEIARRIMRTCRDMGVATVAVFSEADARAPFVRDADEAVRIGPPPSVESYLRIDRLIDAAKRTGADAIHPGYGFLSENAALAEACDAAGIVFIGPPAKAIRAMGSKREAKAIATEAGVPVVPGYDGAKQDTGVLAAKAREVGFPVLLKASAGGGGKGMRVVSEERALLDAIESARREAQSAFGDGTLLIEKYVESPRHVEIQILGDAHGEVLHLFERECSIQRRHQKILEESPSPALDADLRRRMGEAAVKVARAIGYTSAGTVEFILAPDGSFYFLEVNTRLQVEHPVTECITGLDLVREQIRVARGERLGYGQADVTMRGAALEARIYAEDPASGFLPDSGRVVDWHIPPMQGLRVDGGVETGSEVSIHYDPMLAKIVTWGGDREEARQKMVRALRTLSVQGLKTNRAFLIQILEHPEYVAGHLETHFIERHLDLRVADAPSAEVVARAAIAATLAAHETRRAAPRPVPHVPSGWRNNPGARQELVYAHGDAELHVAYVHRAGRFDVAIDGGASVEAEIVSWDGVELVWEADGVRRRARVVVDRATHYVHQQDGAVALELEPRFPDKAAEEVAGACVAPMPGKIVHLRVEEGHHVEAGQVLLVMEAMKMEHTVSAPHPGTVERLHVSIGDQVDGGQILVVIHEDG